MNQTPVPGTVRTTAGCDIDGGPGQAEVSGNCVIRACGPADAHLIREFVCGLSPRSQYLRFFATVAPPGSGLLRALSGGNGLADILVLTDLRGVVIGHAMAVDRSTTGGQLTSDIGLVVADDWQHRGLGTRLLGVLVSRAAARGVATLVLDILPANDRMLGIIRRRWPGAPEERTADSITIRPALSRSWLAGMPVLPCIVTGSSGSHRNHEQGVRSAQSRSAA